MKYSICCSANFTSLRPGERRSRNARRGLSLLEVIIATGILAASSVMLLGILSTGERHARQAQRRVLGQMLCQSKLDECLAGPLIPTSADGDPIPGYPDWMCYVKETPTEMPGIVRLEVSVTRVDSGQEKGQLDPSRERKTFELVRLVRRTAKPQAIGGAMNSDVEAASSPIAAPIP